MFQDEASFGRISEPSYCWCPKGVRPTVPSHRVREYVYTFGAVDPISGDRFFIISPKCNTAWMNEYLRLLSEEFKDDYILLGMDRASWHTSSALIVPSNIQIFHILAYTPEMNPIEPLWREVRKDGFKNTLFNSLNEVINKLSNRLMSLTNDVIKSVCGWEWVISMF
jgi:putative transposase